MTRISTGTNTPRPYAPLLTPFCEKCTWFDIHCDPCQSAKEKIRENIYQAGLQDYILKEVEIILNKF